MDNWWIRGARILDPLAQSDTVGDVLICDRTIQAMGANLAPPENKVQEVDGRGCILGPGLVDLYSQSGEPGHESRETLAQLLQASLRGGFTRVGLLPSTTPAIDNPAQVKPRIMSGPDMAQPLPWGAITVGTAGEQLTDLIELHGAGVVGLADGLPLNNGRLVQRLLEYVHPLTLPLALWPCDPSQPGICRDGADAIRLGLSPLPSTSETTPLTAILEEVAVSQCAVHIMRVSTARSVAIIRDAKARGLPITASVTWAHLLFSTADLESYAPSLRLNPPLGTPADRDALIAGLEDGTLDAIAVDHCAYSYEEKAVPFGVAPVGTIGLPLVLPVLWQTFVVTQRWTALQLWGYLSVKPTQCLGLKPATLHPGESTNLTLFDPNHEWFATLATLGCDPINTVYSNQRIRGQVRQVWSAPVEPVT
ncbi:dihydroorotase [Leptothoe kymatousa]|uniref:Dihydroorotase n=1 Tax=Leptothoe kymatousa TAU-MAC 1615 TaxID=2364775 RepID=A0ABS5Y3F3_9CYAN|nr:dihydroorotase [Leptothoe kymatousa]MBT9312369.1 dihydroorotase [Leptothoe kymatousa TAU-MAC 1615]